LLGEEQTTGLTALFDLTMLVVASGQERSRKEYERLLNAAGLQVTNVIPMRASMFVIEAAA